ncbi:MAG: cation:proton antiporter [Polyangiales bacterium]
MRLPTVAGLLAAGALVGPFGLGLVTSVGAIEVLAEVGVVLLLFSIGLEFSSRGCATSSSGWPSGARCRYYHRGDGGRRAGAGAAVGARVFYGFVVALEHGHRAARSVSAASSTRPTGASSSAR